VLLSDASAAEGPPRSASVEAIVSRAERAQLADHPRWQSLLHYEREWLPPRLRSRALGEDFFLSPDGDRDAQAELRATLEAMLDPHATLRDGSHPQCIYPARSQWLAHELGLTAEQLPAVACTEYEQWRRQLAPTGLTLIFPEGFLNSPGSMFGHTILRIDSEVSAGGAAILGHGVDFTADSAADNPFLAVLKGIFGFYPGFFSVRPYFTLLKRYSDWENRNIWEYRLDVDPDQIDFLLMHLWELRGIEFPYLFFTKNCSYELLRVIEVGIEDLRASDQLRGPVIPADAVRALLAHPGLFDEARYRPAPETELRVGLQALPRDDRQTAQAIAWGRLDPLDASLQAIPPLRRARLLEVAYDQLRYEFLAKQISEEESRPRSRQILVARSRVDVDPEASAAPAVPVPEVRPDQGHGSSRVALSGGWRDDESYVELRWQPAFHDLIDDDSGFPQGMELRFLDTRLRIYPQSKRVRLQRLTLIDLTSLSPRSRVFRPVAWHFDTGLRSRRVEEDDSLEDAYVWNSELGVGLAYDPLPSLLTYGFLHARLEVGAELDHRVAFGPGARVGAYLGRPESAFAAHLFADATQFVAGDTTTWVRTGLEARTSLHRNAALVAEGSYNRLYGRSWFQGALSVNLYF
jgi:hypothetical protein